MFGIGGFELFIILVFGFLIFGPDKLPEIAKTVGKGIARFREAQQEVNDTLGGEKIFDPNNPDEPFKDPVEVLDKLAKKQEEKKAAKAKEDRKKPSTAASGNVATSDAPKQESFTERKARYERERAARKAAEAAGVDDSSNGEAFTTTRPGASEAGSPESATDGFRTTTDLPATESEGGGA